MGPKEVSDPLSPSLRGDTQDVKVVYIYVSATVHLTANLIVQLGHGKQ